MSKGDFANKIYDILIETCGAKPEERMHFINAMSDAFGMPEEYRFMGALGFGGKIWPQALMVSCHQKDLNPKRQKMIAEANTKLMALKSEINNF